MFCKKCGTQIRDDAKFCPKCGTPTGVPVQSNSTNKRRLPKFVIPTVVAIAAVVVVIIVAVVVHSHRVEENNIVSGQDAIGGEYVSGDGSDSSKENGSSNNEKDNSGEDCLSEKYFLELEDAYSGQSDADVYEQFQEYSLSINLNDDYTFDDDFIHYTTFEWDSYDNSIDLDLGATREFNAHVSKSQSLSYMHEAVFADYGYHLGWQAYKFVEGSGYEEDTGGVYISSPTYHVDATSGERVIGVNQISAEFVKQGIYVIKLSLVDPNDNTVASIISGVIRVNS